MHTATTIHKLIQQCVFLRLRYFQILAVLSLLVGLTDNVSYRLQGLCIRWALVVGSSHIWWSLLFACHERWLWRMMLPRGGSLCLIELFDARPAPGLLLHGNGTAMFLVRKKVTLVTCTTTILKVGSVRCRLCIEVSHIEYYIKDCNLFRFSRL